MKTANLLFYLLAIFLGTQKCSASLEFEPDFKIRGSKTCNWWLLGQTINFRGLTKSEAKELPAYRNKLKTKEKTKEIVIPNDWKTITGTIYNSANRKIAQKTVNIQEFLHKGFNWKPSKPGFYSIEFNVKNQTNNSLSLYETLSSQRGWTVKVPQTSIKLFRHEFAVLPSHSRQENRQYFGASIVWNTTQEEVNILPLLGFGFVRLHPVRWYLIEPRKGEYNWAITDGLIKKLQEKNIDCIANLWGTPKWASSRPDAPGKGIWQDYFAAYAPAKNSDLADFLKAFMKRYPFIKNWEIWNEPHLPGQSIFWRSSPKEFAAMQKAGYETIKQLSPNSTVWLGGIGMRYLPFYQKIIKLGTGKYFDVLPLHGRDVDPKPFNAINRKYGVAPKPWVQGEWHAILYKTAEKNPPTETKLSHDMLKDLMLAFQRKVSKVVVWGWRQGTEREFYKHFHNHGEKRVSIGGFFRSFPYCEPRLPLVVLCNFMNCFSGKISVIGSYGFDKGSQQAVLMKSSAGNTLFFWQNKSKKVKPAFKLTEAFSKSGILQNWEGQILKADSSFQLKPDLVYFLKNPNQKIMNSWEKYQADIQQKKNVILNSNFHGYYRNGSLFDKKMEIINPENLIWQSVKDYIPIVAIGNTKKSELGLTGRFALGLADGAVDLLVEVKDKVHIQKYPAEKLWNGDSIQFAFDATQKGRSEDRIEFGACMSSNGPVLWKLFAPMLVGDLPARYTDPPARVKFGKIKIDQSSGKISYKIHISRNDLFPLAHMKGQPVRFSLLINNNNGKGRNGYLEWASGIGNGKRPQDYGTMTVYMKETELLSQQDLKIYRGKSRADIGEKIAKVTISNSNTVETLRTAPLPLTPGIVYTISFSARGNIDLRLFARLSGTQNKRLDIIRRSPLKLKKDQWINFKKTLIFPSTATNAVFCIFGYKQQGFFEIKNFSLKIGSN